MDQLRVIKQVFIFIFPALLKLSCSYAQSPGNLSLSISDNGRYFIDNHHKPFFWQGDTEWELFHLFSVADAKIFLSERKKQGFNVIQVMVTGVYPEWDTLKGVKHESAMDAWLRQDPLTPNENYFKRTDSIISLAEEDGIILAIGVYHAIDVDKHRINLQNARHWATWLSSRYRFHNNIIWSMYPHASQASVPILNEILEGIKAGDGGSHLITAHPDPSPKSSSFFQQPWFSFNTLQTWNSGFINYEMVTADYSDRPVIPVVNGEARYEGEDGTTPFETRRAGYWSYLAGGFYSFGHRDNWMAPKKWRSWYQSEGTRQMKIMGNIFRSVQWWKLVPDTSILKEPATGDVAARSADSDWIIAYLTTMKRVTVRLNKCGTLKKVTAWWYKPVTGETIKTGTYNTTGSQDFLPPANWEDAVLVIKK